jgi:hypothetical protein
VTSSTRAGRRYATLANVRATMVGIVTDPLGDANKFNWLVLMRRRILPPLPFRYRQVLRAESCSERTCYRADGWGTLLDGIILTVGLFLH